MMNRKLSGIQWMSIVIVTVGCMIQKMDFTENSSINLPEDDYEHDFRFAKLRRILSFGADMTLVLVQVNVAFSLKIIQKLIINLIAAKLLRFCGSLH